MLFQRQRHVLLFGEEGVIEDRALQGADRVAQLLDDDVVRGQQDGLVEGDVGLMEARQVVAVFEHGVVARFDRDQVDGRRPLRGPARNHRFDQAAHLDQRSDQRRIGAFLEHPAEHVDVEVIPVLARHDEQPAVRLGVDQTLGRQDADDLAHHVARGEIAAAQLGFGGQGCAGRVLALRDRFAKLLHQLLGLGHATRLHVIGRRDLNRAGRCMPFTVAPAPSRRERRRAPRPAWPSSCRRGKW